MDEMSDPPVILISMGQRSFPEVLHELADAIGNAAQGGPGLRAVSAWAEASGWRVEENEHSLVIRLVEDDTVLVVSLSVVTAEPRRGARSLFAALRNRSVNVRGGGVGADRPGRANVGIVTAINAGELTTEIDEAVGWDPELAV